MAEPAPASILVGPVESGARSAPSRTAPVLRAYRTKPSAGAVGVTVWCCYCERPHAHGIGGGLRAAHCIRPESPYRATGYSLDPQDGWIEVADVRPSGPLAGRERLCDALDVAAGTLRNAVARAALGVRGHATSIERRIGTARVAVSGNGWWIDPDAFATRRRRAAAQPPAAAVSGTGLVALLSALYGLPAGIVVGRLLHAFAPGCLDAAGWLDVAAAVEASLERQAARERDGTR